MRADDAAHAALEREEARLSGEIKRFATQVNAARSQLNASVEYLNLLHRQREEIRAAMIRLIADD